MRRKTLVPSDTNHPARFPRSQAAKLRLRGWWAGLCAVMVLVGLAGCGTNIDSILAQSGTAAGTTVLDILLTDFTNQVADAFDQNAPQPADGDDDDDGGNDDDGGEVSPGQQAYADNGCGACHGADAQGASAPAMAGEDQTDAMDARFSGGAEHFGSTLTDQEIADIVEWLSGDGGGDEGGGDEGLDGTAIYADNCAMCHGEDGTGGIPIAGLNADEMSAGLESATHGSISLSDDEVAAIAEFLGG